MTWLISKALMQDYENSRCSQEQGEEYSEATCSDGARSALLSSTPMPQAFLPPDKMTAFSRPSRSGMTFAPLTASHGADLLTWFLADSRVRTFPLLDQAPALMASGRASGQKWPASLTKYDPGSCSWKTAQLSLLGGSDEFSETWPKWGSMRSGECWERTMSAPLTAESASGSWPTPLANSHTGAGHGPNKTGAPNLQTVVAQAEKWPTPTVCGNYNRKGASKTSGDGLATVVASRSTTSCSASTDAPTAKARMWPTATATSAKGWSPGHNQAETDDRLDYSVERLSFQAGQTTPPKRLNPEWVEWLMGWPQGWTALKPLEMARFHEWQRQHLPCSVSDNKSRATLPAFDIF